MIKIDIQVIKLCHLIAPIALYYPYFFGFLPTCLINVNYIIVSQNLTYVTSNTNGSYRELPERAVLRVARDHFSYGSLVCWTETLWEEAGAIRESI